MKLYLGHSVRPEDSWMLESLAGIAPRYSIELAVAQRPWDPPHTMPERAAASIRGSECVLFWLMDGGQGLYCANLEAGFVRNSAQHVPILLFRDSRVRPTGCLQAMDGIVLDEGAPWACVEKTWHIFQNHGFGPERTAKLRGFLLAAAGLALLGAARGGGLQPSPTRPG